MADLKLTDLRVAKAEPSRMNLRFATIDDILEVAATLPGAEKRWVCVRDDLDRKCYSLEGRPVRPVHAAMSKLHADCGWRLVIPLEDT